MMAKTVEVEVAGIDNLLALVAFGKGVRTAYEAAKSDGKINIFDIAHIVPLFASGRDAWQGRNEFMKEFKDLDDNEVEILNAAVGSVIQDLAYQKIFSGIVQMAQGVFMVIERK